MLHVLQLKKPCPKKLKRKQNTYFSKLKHSEMVYVIIKAALLTENKTKQTKNTQIFCAYV